MYSRIGGERGRGIYELTHGADHRWQEKYGNGDQEYRQLFIMFDIISIHHILIHRGLYSLNTAQHTSRQVDPPTNARPQTTLLITTRLHTRPRIQLNI